MDPLIKQYEDWAYPRRIGDINVYRSQGGHDLSDPSRIGHKLWRGARAQGRLKILVAGCGANQAAILAHANPQCEVVGIDLSSQAIAYHRWLQARHSLTNLQCHQLNVLDVGTLSQSFDLVVCTGVLHHMKQPDAGLYALRGVLAPHGVMSLMLYGKHARTGVAMVQEGMRTLGIGRSPSDVTEARGVVASLPAWHAARSYAQFAPDLDYDAGFVDTFLNAREQAYSIPEILALVARCGLRFGGWLDSLEYSPSATLPPDSPAHDRFEDLSREAVWHVVDLLTQRVGAHRFLVRNGDHLDIEEPVDFEAALDEDTWLNLVPHLAADVELERRPGGLLEIARLWHRVTLQGALAAVLLAIDGVSDCRALLQHSAHGMDPMVIADQLAELVEWGYLWAD